MEKIKIIFFDIDGTLLDHATGCISPKTLEALRLLRERGVLLCVASGRSPVVFPDFGDVRFDAFCAFNGSLCYADGKVIYSNPIAHESVERVLENAAAIGRPVCVAVRHRMAANGWDQDLSDYYGLANLELKPAKDFDAVRREEVYQMMLGSRPEEHEAILRGTKGIKIAVSWERAVDIIPDSSGKGASVGKILEYFGLQPSQAMAFGDSYNDLEMLQAVGVGVAMGNANDALKAVADDVCGPVSEDGIYEYCIRHGLIQ